ncbi:MAG TPA: hypothetical protein VFK02_15925 [Kofleriaceae bacterium]|nr:hypothetical protein [Kofleriaceae bacterium]
MEAAKKSSRDQFTPLLRLDYGGGDGVRGILLEESAMRGLFDAWRVLKQEAL